MPSNTSPHASQEGTLQISATDMITELPIAGATVTITRPDQPDDILVQTQTDGNGQTDTIPLPAPPREYSQKPEALMPYSTYSIRIESGNYESVQISGAQLMSGEKALQNTQLLPLVEGMPAQSLLYPVGPHTLYGDYAPKEPESEVKPVNSSGQVVLSRVVIPSGVRLITARSVVSFQYPHGSPWIHFVRSYSPGG